MAICGVVPSESPLTYNPVRSGGKEHSAVTLEGIPPSALHLTIPEQAPTAMPSESPVDRLCDRLGYRFRNPVLLREALTHKSHLNELPDPTRRDSERLEFLGDAVLDLVISDLLLVRFPEAPEGELSKLKARLVSEAALSSVAKELDLGAALALGRGEELTGGREKPSLLADAQDALLAAVYLDAGLDAAQAFIVRMCEGAFEDLSHPDITHHKTALQE